MDSQVLPGRGSRVNLPMGMNSMNNDRELAA